MSSCFYEITRGVQTSSFGPYDGKSSSPMFKSLGTKQTDVDIFGMVHDLGDENALPAAPYAEEGYFALTTFRSTSKTPPAAKLFSAIKDFLQNAPLVEPRLQKKHNWELHCEFFHLDRKNEFSISFYEDSIGEQTQSCLLEMQLISGDHLPFQKLVELIRQQFQLVYAFGLLSTMIKENSKSPNTSDFFIDDRMIPKFESSPAELDTILKHVQSPYADVQIRGWETLSQITRTKTVAKALLERKIHGQESVVGIQSLKSTGSHDQQRLIEKTMQNMMSVVESIVKPIPAF